jgi:hypothetical protein
MRPALIEQRRIGGRWSGRATKVHRIAASRASRQLARIFAREVRGAYGRGVVTPCLTTPARRRSRRPCRKKSLGSGAGVPGRRRWLPSSTRRPAVGERRELDVKELDALLTGGRRAFALRHLTFSAAVRPWRLAGGARSGVTVSLASSPPATSRQTILPSSASACSMTQKPLPILVGEHDSKIEP